MSHRAIVDEVLPPAFLANTLPSLPDGSLGVTVVQATGEDRGGRGQRGQRVQYVRLWGCKRGGQ